MPYFTTEELRALPDVQDADLHPDERLVAAHDWIAAVIERECDTSFVAKPMTEALTGGGRDALFLSSPYVLSVESVTVDGVATPGSDLVVEHGVVYYGAGGYWSGLTRGNVVVEYTAGYSIEPPADLKEAALRAARNWILTTSDLSAVDTRATGISNADGNITLVIAGEDRPTGLPEVDATIMAWARRVRVPKVS
jgi:hypothetical protein